MTRQLTAGSSLESLKKEAKRWLKALRDSDAEAFARLRRTHDRAPTEPRLRDVQHALALEHGLPNWAALKRAVAEHALARKTRAERVAEFLELACLNYGMRPAASAWDRNYADNPANRERAARLLALDAGIAHESLHTAAVCGDLEAVERILSQRPEAAGEKRGPHLWEPLLYLCYGRLPVAAAADNAVAIAARLLDAGADPNCWLSDGENRFTALTGVIGEGERTWNEVPPHPRAADLARLLLDRGADPLDRQALYNTSLWRDDATWLELLYSYSERAGTAAKWIDSVDRAGGVVTYLLGNAVTRNHVRRAQWLLAHGADPDARHGYSKRHLQAEATLHGFTEMAALLRGYGGKDVKLEGRDAFQAACMRLDRAEAAALARRHPEYLAEPGPFMAAAAAGREEVVTLLLELGVPVDIAAGDGTRALHQATWTDAAGVGALLIAHGADVDCRERRFGATPLGWALHMDKPRMAELLKPLSRDAHSLARAGDAERLRAVLAEEPALANSIAGLRRLSPLFCLPEHDEERAVAVAEVLLAHGADPMLKNAEGIAAVEFAKRQGLEEVADLLLEGVAISGVRPAQ